MIALLLAVLWAGADEPALQPQHAVLVLKNRQVLEGDDIGEIRAKTEALQEASHKLAEAVYASAQQQTSTASAAGNGGAADDEVVEEGDYEVIDEEQEAPKA